MLSTTAALILASLALLAGLYSVWFARTLARAWRDQTIAKLEKSRLTALEGELTDLSDAVDSVRASMKRMRARKHLAIAREAQNGAGADAVPDSATDPDGFKRAMRLKHLRR